MNRKYYRYYEYHSDGATYIRLEEFPVTKETPKGVILDVYGSRRLVLHDSIKKYAYPFIDDAQESFRRRKIRQIIILEAQLKRAKRAFEAADNGKFDGSGYRHPLFT